MKTQTSKTRIWLSTLLVLPIIAILFYSFAEKEYVEKETTDIADAIKEELKEVDAYKHQYVGDNIVEIYLEKFNQYEILRNDEPHYIHKSESEKNQMEDLFSDLGGIYFRMSKENKANVKRPISPIKPYVQITLKDKTYYKKYKELTAEEKATLPPPPPPTKNSQSYISIQEKPIMVILINRKGDLLINDEQGSISDIESKLKKLSKSFNKSRAVYVKYEGTEDSYKVIKDVKSLIKKYDFKMIHADASQIAPPPPPVKQQKSKGGPNTEDTQSIYNPTFLEYINEMENESASFYLDDEKISAKEAKAIATNHKGKRTEMTTLKDSNGNYIVKLSSAENKKIYARSIELKILNDNSYLIDGIKATKETFVDVFNQLHQDITSEERKNYMNIHVKSSKDISNKEVWFIFNSLQDYGFYRIVAPNQEINRAKGNTPFAIESHISIQDKPTDEEVSAYNAWAKQLKKETLAAQENERNGKTANYPIVKQKDLIKYVGIYKRMTTKQKQNSVALPIADDELKTTSLKFPPPPPPTKQNQSYTFKSESGEIIEVVEDPQPEKKERILPILNGRVSKTGQLSMSLTEIKKIILTLPNSGVTAFKLKTPGLSTQQIKGNTINDEAIKNLNSSKTGDVITLFNIKDDQESDIAPVTIKITEEVKTQKPQSITPVINGKALKSGKTSMTRAEFKALKLSTKNGAATQFNIKIPHKPTQSIKGNTIDATTIKNLATIKAKTEVIIFNIEDGSDSNVEPIIITITD